jgi:hypothetical protein
MDSASRTILALDLGKYKSVACTYAGDPADARFQSLTTDRAHLRRLFDQLRPAAVVIEACTLAGWVHDLCAECGLVCRVANTAAEADYYHVTPHTFRHTTAMHLLQSGVEVW